MKVIKKSSDLVVYDMDCHTIEQLLSIYPDMETMAWCDGYLFVVISIDSYKFAEVLLEENVKVLAAVDFAKMQYYKPVIKNNNNVGVYVMDHSNSQAFQALAKYVRKNYCKAAESEK